jgi:hypothetical protein
MDEKSEENYGTMRLPTRVPGTEEDVIANNNEMNEPISNNSRKNEEFLESGTGGGLKVTSIQPTGLNGEDGYARIEDDSTHNAIWNQELTIPSLPEVYGSVTVDSNAPWWRVLLCYVGPGALVAVGYMDPGEWLV